MQEESLITACVCLTLVILLNASCGILIEERRMVNVPAVRNGVSDKVAAFDNRRTFKEAVRKANVSDWRPKTICSGFEGAGYRKCLPCVNEEKYQQHLAQALTSRLGFHVIFSNWSDCPLWLTIPLYLSAVLPTMATILVVRESLSIQARACMVNILRTLIYLSLFQPIQLAVFVGPIGLLPDYYMKRVPIMAFITPSVLGVSLEQAAWFIPAIQVIMSCYSLIVISRYSRTFIPTLSFRDYVARDFHLGDPRDVEDVGLQDLYWEQFLHDASRERQSNQDEEGRTPFS